MIEILPQWPQWATREPRRDAPADPGEGDYQPTMGDLSAALLRAELFDNRVIDLPGAVVTLPDGLVMLELFRAQVHRAYRAVGLAEHEYPALVPASYLDPARELVDLEGQLLFAGTDAQLRDGSSDLALLPTGEGMIYTHWSRRVRTRRDLPIRMYRRARYFRPVSRGRHAGRGVFYGMEHDDIFEFHCAYGSAGELRREIPRLWDAMDGVARALHVPVVWSTRPPWTNRREVAEWVLGGDAPLPLRATTQVGALYNQGSRFSRPYDVGFREDGLRHHTSQLCGYVSRRLALVHVLLGMRPSGWLFLHPDLAPVQVAVLEPRHDETGRAFAADAVQQLRARGVRARLARHTKRAWTSWGERGAPLVVGPARPATGDERIVTVVRRADSEEAIRVDGDDSAALARRCIELLAEIGAAWDNRAERVARSRFAEVTDVAHARESLEARLVTVAPLVVDEHAVEVVAAWRAGEVLGFCRAREPRPCIVTGRSVGTVALMSPRV